jgi:general secretion pathway protein G
MRQTSRARRILRWSAAAAGLSFVVLTMTIVKLPSLRRARIDQTRLGIENLERALTVYRSKSGQYPPTTVGFAALSGLGDWELRDGWGNPYRYQLVEDRPVIISFGADGLPGGEGDDADISSLRPKVSSR